jgi:hypothetical protein
MFQDKLILQFLCVYIKLFKLLLYQRKILKKTIQVLALVNFKYSNIKIRYNPRLKYIMSNKLRSHNFS